MPANPPVAVIFHGNCLDGFTAAYAAWLRLIEEDGRDPADVSFHPFRHDDPLPDVDGKEVYILDFSFLPPVMDQLAARAESIVLLDHHASAEHKLSGWRCACAQIKFDQNKSGAMLAWEHFHPDKPAPLLVHMVEDQDLHRFALPNSRDFNNALTLEPQDFSRWHTLANLDAAGVDALLRIGRHATNCLKSICAETLPYFHQIHLGGRPVFAVNAPAFLASDIAGKVDPSHEHMAAIWHVNGENTVEVSLRGTPEILPVAVAHGGGGNKTMSAFRMPLDRWLDVLARATLTSMLALPQECATQDRLVHKLVVNKLSAMSAGRQSVREIEGAELLVVNTLQSLASPLATRLASDAGKTALAWALIDSQTVEIHGVIANPNDVYGLGKLCVDLEFHPQNPVNGDIFSGTMATQTWFRLLQDLPKPDDATIEIHTRPMALA